MAKMKERRKNVNNKENGESKKKTTKRKKEREAKENKKEVKIVCRRYRWFRVNSNQRKIHMSKNICIHEYAYMVWRRKSIEREIRFNVPCKNQNLATG